MESSVPGGKPRRLKKKFSDFLLRFTRDITLAVVEAQSDKRPAGDGPQKDKDFAPFGEARMKIEGEAIKSREMYFAIYQAIAKDERRPGLYREYARDFFDLIIIDECHRGSSRDESNWREIREYFAPAYQLGMTATPLREDNRDTLQLLWQPSLHLQPETGNRRRLSVSIPCSSSAHDI